MKDLNVFILAGSLDPWSLQSLDSETIRERLKSVYFGWIPGSLNSEMIRERLKSVYFGWIPRSLEPWIFCFCKRLFVFAGSLDPRILRQLMKELSLFILAGSLDPWSLGSLDSETISKRLKSVYFGWIPGSLKPWILGF